MHTVFADDQTGRFLVPLIISEAFINNIGEESG